MKKLADSKLLIIFETSIVLISEINFANMA